MEPDRRLPVLLVSIDSVSVDVPNRAVLPKRGRSFLDHFEMIPGSAPTFCLYRMNHVPEHLIGLAFDFVVMCDLHNHAAPDEDPSGSKVARQSSVGGDEARAKRGVEAVVDGIGGDDEEDKAQGEAECAHFEHKMQPS